MNTNHHSFSSAVAAIAAGAAVLASPTALGAHAPGHRETCPAIDTEPVCEIVRPRSQPGSDEAVTQRPRPDGTAVWTGDVKDHPRYGPVNRTDRASDSDCHPPYRSPTSGDVAACSQRRPDDESRNGTAELIDIGDYNCDEWRNPVIACPGLDGSAAVTNTPDYNCIEWRNPVIACPG